MRIAWSSKGVPPVMLVSGENDFLRRRYVKHIVDQAHTHKHQITFAGSDADVREAMTSFMVVEPTLVVVSVSDVQDSTVANHLKSPEPNVGILLVCETSSDEKKYPVVARVPVGFCMNFPMPEKKTDLEKQAVQFAQHEADRLLGKKGALDIKLAEAIVRAVGVDLGLVSFEILKMALLAKQSQRTDIDLEIVRGAIRGAREAEMQPVRDALMQGDAQAMAKALQKISAQSDSDPTMLLLRAKGGPADLAYQWLQASFLMQKGMDAKAISAALGAPEWAVSRDVIPTVKRWKHENLRKLVEGLSMVDRGLLLGIPAPWVACQAVLLSSCRAIS